MSIASPATRAQYADLKRLLRHASDRRSSGRFVVEGPVLVAELLASDLVVDLVIGTPGLLDRLGPLANPAAVAEADRLAAALSTTSPQLVAAIARIPGPVDPEILPPGPVLALVGIADPGNTGTMIRTAEAGGAVAVVQVGDRVDPWNPKVVRASAGAVLRIPVIPFTLPAFLAWGRRPTVASVVQGGEPYETVDLVDAVICVGSEAHGLPEEVIAGCDRRVTIPLAGPTESLNAAAAAAVLVFDALRQRRLATLPLGSSEPS